jgi:hypothetical protein
MATYAGARADPGAINGQAAIALALLSAWDHKTGETGGGPTIEEISRIVARLMDHDIGVYDVRLRRVPGSLYSEDVETFVGHLLAEGLATQRSPIKLTGQGEALLRTIIRLEAKNHAFTVRRAAELLQLDASDILAGIA